MNFLISNIKYKLYNIIYNEWKVIFDISANNLKKDVLTYFKDHLSVNAIQKITDFRLMNETSTNHTVSGAYFVNINDNYGFMCDRSEMMNQHTANLICESLGWSRAEPGNGTGWFQKG